MNSVEPFLQIMHFNTTHLNKNTVRTTLLTALSSQDDSNEGAQPLLLCNEPLPLGPACMVAQRGHNTCKFRKHLQIQKTFPSISQDIRCKCQNTCIFRKHKQTQKTPANSENTCKFRKHIKNQKTPAN